MREEWLRGLARNPSTPPEVLFRLLEPDASVCWNELCSTRDLPPEVIEAIIGHPDRRVRCGLARNGAVAPEQRARLARDPDSLVRMDLAEGSRSRWDPPLPDETINDLLTTADGDVFEGFLASVHVRHVFDLAAAHPSPGVRAWVSWFAHRLGGDLWQVVQADSDPQVREAVAAARAYAEEPMHPGDLPPQPTHGYWDILTHRRLSPALVEHITRRDLVDELCCLANNPATPQTVVAALVEHGSPEVRCATAGRADLTHAQLLGLVADADISVRTAVSVHPALSEAQRAAIVIDACAEEDFRPDRYIVTPRPVEESARLAESVNVLLRRRAARDWRLCNEVAERLAEDEDLGVRVLLAQHHRAATPELRLRCFIEYAGPGRWELVSRHGFPSAGLARFAGDADPELRRLALRDAELNPDVVDQLTRDPDCDVRRAAAAHPALPPARIIDALREADLAEGAAANASLPPTTMHALLDEAGLGAGRSGSV